MENKYRIKTSFSRISRDKLETRRCFYLSVEGNCTEREYFEGFNKHKEELGLKGYVRVTVLKRSKHDTHSLPNEVLELLEEFINYHDGNIDPEQLGLPKNILKRFSTEELRLFLNGCDGLSEERANEIDLALAPCYLGLCYRNFKNDYDSDKDIFAVIVDRDQYTHTKEMLEACIKECDEKGYDFYISNPCFEFWLLMHRADILCEYGDKLEEIKANRKGENRRTFVSSLVSEKAGHGKSMIGFEHNYLHCVNYAMEQSKSFETDKHKLIDNIGSNLAELIEKMRK